MDDFDNLTGDALLAKAEERANHRRLLAYKLLEKHVTYKYSKSQMSALYEKAGDAYTKERDFPKAAHAYVQALEYDARADGDLYWKAASAARRFSPQDYEFYKEKAKAADIMEANRILASLQAPNTRPVQFKEEIKRYWRVACLYENGGETDKAVYYHKFLVQEAIPRKWYEFAASSYARLASLEREPKFRVMELLCKLIHNGIETVVMDLNEYAKQDWFQGSVEYVFLNGLLRSLRAGDVRCFDAAYNDYKASFANGQVPTFIADLVTKVRENYRQRLA